MNQPGDDWKCEVVPKLTSAYKSFVGEEPNFTNYAQVRGETPFIDTLDYIFCSDGFKVNGVEKLPHRDMVAGPLPNEEEPSDHILISAEMELLA